MVMLCALQGGFERVGPRPARRLARRSHDHVVVEPVDSVVCSGGVDRLDGEVGKWRAEHPAHERYVGLYIVGVHFASGHEAYLIGPGPGAEVHAGTRQAGRTSSSRYLLLAVRLVQRVLEADPGVEASADLIIEEYPLGFSVSVLQPWGREVEAVKRPVNLFDQPECAGGSDLHRQCQPLPSAEQRLLPGSFYGGADSSRCEKPAPILPPDLEWRSVSEDKVSRAVEIGHSTKRMASRAGRSNRLSEFTDTRIQP